MEIRNGSWVHSSRLSRSSADGLFSFLSGRGSVLSFPFLHLGHRARARERKRISGRLLRSVCWAKERRDQDKGPAFIRDLHTFLSARAVVKKNKRPKTCSPFTFTSARAKRQEREGKVLRVLLSGRCLPRNQRPLPFHLFHLARAHVKTRAEEKERKRKRKGQWKRLRDGWILDPPSVSSLPPPPTSRSLF